MNQAQPGPGPKAGDAPSSLRAAHVRDTRRVLLDTARQVFADHGFQATRTEEIVQRAGLTRGALYHHFRDKEDLFRAVHEDIVGEVTQLLRRRSGDGRASAWELFRANSEIYLDAASTNRAYRQIVLIDGPAVMGWNAVSERHDGPTHRIFQYLQDAMDEGVLEQQPVEPLGQLLSALGVAAAMYVAHAGDPEAARREITRCYEQFLSGLGVSDVPPEPAHPEPSPG